MTPFPTSRRNATLAAAALTALALTACNPVSNVGPSPTPSGSHLASPYVPAPSATESASPSAPATPSATASATATGTGSAADAKNVTVAGLLWPDGKEVSASRLTPAAPTATLKATPLPQSKAGAENWLTMTLSGEVLGLSGKEKAGLPFYGVIRLKGGKAANAIGAASDPFAGSQERLAKAADPTKARGPFPLAVASAGEGFVVLSRNVSGGDDVSGALYAVKSPGGAATLLKQFPSSNGAVVDVAIGKDSTGVQRAYWSRSVGTSYTVESMPLAGGPVQTEAEDAIHPVMTKRGLYAQSIGKTTGDNKGLPAATGIGPVKNGRVQPIFTATYSTGYELGASVSPDGRYVSVPLGESALPEDKSTLNVGLSVDVQSKKASILLAKNLVKDGAGSVLGAVDGFIAWRSGETLSYLRADGSINVSVPGAGTHRTIPVMISGLADGATRLLAPSTPTGSGTPGWVATLP